jgi:hypothetical protein
MKKLVPIVLCVVFFASCKKQSEEIVITQISDYAPLKAGKYITYNLDSTVFTNFGTVEAHRFYEVKYATTDSITDNLGRKAFRIIRYIRSTPTGTFLPDNTAMAVNTGSRYEFIENNLRYFKLTLPINDGNSWKGNAAIDLIVNPSLGIDLAYLGDWDYTYENVDQPSPRPISTFNLPNTVTINQRDISSNLPVTPATNIASKDFSQEIYAKGIGMVYRNFLHWEYQKSSGSYTGYGVKLTMIDHN